MRRGWDTLNSGGLALGLYPAPEPRQRFPTGVGRTLFAGARFEVAVLAAARAKSFAVRLAQRSDRQGQKHLLAQHILKQKTVSLIITDFGLGRCNGPFGGLGVGADGAEEEVKVRCQRDLDRFDAASAGDLELAGIAALEADVGNDVPGTTVLVEHLGAAGSGERAFLGGFFAEVDGSGGELEFELDGLFLELAYLKFHKYERTAEANGRQCGEMAFMGAVRGSVPGMPTRRGSRGFAARGGWDGQRS